MLAESPVWNRTVLFKHTGTLDCPRALHVLSVAPWWPRAICCRILNSAHGAGAWEGIGCCLSAPETLRCIFPQQLLKNY